MYRRLTYYLASFVSILGDVLLATALPLGLGMDSGDIRYTVAMFLIPGIAMYASTHLSHIIKKRVSLARKDYGYLLLIVAILEVALSIAIHFSKDKILTLILCSIFVFLYAMIKEGLPRLFYMVSVHNYFCNDNEYANVLGKVQGFNILAFVVGSLLAAWLLMSQSWKLSLIIDALTFAFLGLVIIFLGKDPISDKKSALSKESTPHSLSSELKVVKTLLPMMMGVSLLIWPYIPIITNDLEIMSVSNSVILIAFLNLPGMISGLFFGKLRKTQIPHKLIWTLPIVYSLSCLSFISIPGKFTLTLIIFIRGLVQGLYWPSDFFFRNKLPNDEQIDFNTQVLKEMSITQILSCVIALYIFKLENFTMAGSIVVGAYLFWYLRKLFPLRVVLPALLILFSAISILTFKIVNSLSSQL